MIAFLTGTVAAKGDGFALLDVNGVGYRLLMSATSLSTMPAEGDRVTVQTHLHVREDELTLFGFEGEEERAAFEALIAVSGVGPKVALATLSVLSPDTLAAAVATGDSALLASVPGVGKKTAARMLLDLADKLSSPSGATPSAAGASGSSGMGQAREALLSMGFTAAEVTVALGGAPQDDTEAAIRHALLRLGGGS